VPKGEKQYQISTSNTNQCTVAQRSILALMMEAACSSEMLAHSQNTTGHNNAEYYRRENLTTSNFNEGSMKDRINTCVVQPSTTVHTVALALTVPMTDQAALIKITRFEQYGSDAYLLGTSRIPNRYF
jgi:hypothetical protein